MSTFAELAEHASLPFELGRMLPLGAYCDPAVLAAEHRALFADEWICVGRTADIPARGDYLTAVVPLGGATAGHRSVIVLRGDDGEVAAFDNVCIHRGAQLLEGCGTTARITCPYHAWAFRLDGGLIGGPYNRRSSRPETANKLSRIASASNLRVG